MTTFVAPKGYAATREQVEELWTILSIMRPYQSKMEAKFVKQFLMPFKPTQDAMGNLIVRVGDAPVLWSCHTDTVHNFGGIAPLAVDDKGIIHVPKYSLANCLGADDGVGVWLMMQMIRAKRPGMYVFHRGEERGCIGSRFIATKTPKLLDGIQAAIAFDRKGTGSIITHQFGGRCCSEDFSESLSKSIGLGMKSDDTGTVTDTAQYTDLVGECTNVSVGYMGQHGKGEEQNLIFALELHMRMLEVDYRDLVIKRKPGEKEPRKWGNGYTRTYHRGWGAGMFEGADQDLYAGGYASSYGGSVVGREDGSRHSWDSPKYRYEEGKKWDVAIQGYIWPGREWDEKLGKWVIPPDKQTVRRFIDTRNDVVVCRRTVSKQTPSSPAVEVDTVETYLALVRDFPEEIAALLEDKKYGLSYLHEQIRAHGGVVTTAYRACPAGGKA